jgi:hypothetical protein
MSSVLTNLATSRRMRYPVFDGTAVRCCGVNCVVVGDWLSLPVSASQISYTVLWLPTNDSTMPTRGYYVDEAAVSSSGVTWTCKASMVLAPRASGKLGI